MIRSGYFRTDRADWMEKYYNIYIYVYRYGCVHYPFIDVHTIILYCFKTRSKYTLSHGDHNI